ncbi:aminotransferase class I/II-fold pyridoxal phosphate-dependent enzyme [Mesoflavibacter profundi]|uniref:Aminotransferase class I/II-fold pyridoxal phosphate-dependent enzyme n=1 Tax=Mesoflavibacter profundi TaxID=2708110 RepID=A0ABT4S1J1_9FLAO|nr:aminotransferase class I/II-fold pyridoxal phosphate-dependent enzyme [Mesoflavibacter profundi]MDA0177901.1 aminotransferase class I/II-fold pyridoxal phosphate-dependent enzyme [Mesoflavibacter profundi]
MKSKIWLSTPHMGGSEQKYINEAFQDNWIAPLGPNVTGFETDLENYLSNKNSFVACLSSGTAAIHLALLQLGVSKGDEVICQSFTFCGTANPITYLGANPVFVDSESKTWNMCPDYLEQAIIDRKSKGKTIKAIIVVHLYGMPAQIDKIIDVAKKYDIPVIEDAAEALGSTYNNQKCGTFGEFSILSFNGNKIITTSGGGALVCRSIEHKNKTIYYATQARENTPHYEHTEIGYNYRMSNISAGIGRGQMEVLDKHIGLRQNNNKFYNEIFKDIDGISVFAEPSSQFVSNHWLTCILIDPSKSKITREDIYSKLLEENIESRPLWKPMHLQPVFNKYPYYGTNISEQLFKNGLCLPSGSKLENEELERIKNTLISLFND